MPPEVLLTCTFSMESSCSLSWLSLSLSSSSELLPQLGELQLSLCIQEAGKG